MKRFSRIVNVVGETCVFALGFDPGEVRPGILRVVLRRFAGRARTPLVVNNAKRSSVSWV
jgi:hypothetical protein